MSHYDSLYTSFEILQAIEEQFDGRAYDTTTEAYKEWENPTDKAAIMDRAWALTGDDTLYWGESTLKRPEARFYGTDTETIIRTSKGIYLIQSPFLPGGYEELSEVPEGFEPVSQACCLDLEIPEEII